MARIRNAFSGKALEQVGGWSLLELLTKHAEKDPEKTGQLLRKILEEHGVSQSGAARELGIDARTMRRYIAGDQPLPRVVAWALVAIIKVTGGRPPGS